MRLSTASSRTMVLDFIYRGRCFPVTRFSQTALDNARIHGTVCTRIAANRKCHRVRNKQASSHALSNADSPRTYEVVSIESKGHLVVLHSDAMLGRTHTLNAICEQPLWIFASFMRALKHGLLHLACLWIVLSRSCLALGKRPRCFSITSAIPVLSARPTLRSTFYNSSLGSSKGMSGAYI